MNFYKKVSEKTNRNLRTFLLDLIVPLYLLIEDYYFISKDISVSQLYLARHCCQVLDDTPVCLYPPENTFNNTSC